MGEEVSRLGWPGCGCGRTGSERVRRQEELSYRRDGIGLLGENVGGNVLHLGSEDWTIAVDELLP